MFIGVTEGVQENKLLLKSRAGPTPFKASQTIQVLGEGGLLCFLILYWFLCGGFFFVLWCWGGGERVL